MPMRPDIAALLGQSTGRAMQPLRAVGLKLGESLGHGSEDHRAQGFRSNSSPLLAVGARQLQPSFMNQGRWRVALFHRL